MTRLHHATQQGELRADADHDAIANALIGTLLLKLLSSTLAMDARRDSTDCASGESASTISATLAVSRATVYRVLAKRNNETDSG